MHELYLLNLGLLSWKNPYDGVNKLRPVPGFFIRTNDGQQIVIDTGNPLRLVGDDSIGSDGVPTAQVRPEDDLLARLRQLGTSPAEIDLVISSHFDFDHCGRHDLFGPFNTRVVVQKRHLAFARESERCDPALWNIPGLQFETVDGDTELFPGLTLLETPGHIPGHQSILIDTTMGRFMLAIDVVIDQYALEDPLAPSWYFPQHEQGIRSRDRVLQIAADTGAYLVMGHDPEQMEQLQSSAGLLMKPQKDHQ